MVYFVILGSRPYCSVTPTDMVYQSGRTLLFCSNATVLVLQYKSSCPNTKFVYSSPMCKPQIQLHRKRYSYIRPTGKFNSCELYIMVYHRGQKLLFCPSKKTIVLEHEFSCPGTNQIVLELVFQKCQCTKLCALAQSSLCLDTKFSARARSCSCSSTIQFVFSHD